MMEVVNKVYPNEAQIQGFMEPTPQGEICMVNLLKFKPKAQYQDGRETLLSGREAYELYADGVRKLLTQVGGYIGFVGSIERLALGEVGELWDSVVLAVYPSRKAMLDMMQLDEMREISEHRAAGLAGQLNIETAGFSGQWLEGES